MGYGSLLPSQVHCRLGNASEEEGLEGEGRINSWSPECAQIAGSSFPWVCTGEIFTELSVCGLWLVTTIVLQCLSFSQWLNVAPLQTSSLFLCARACSDKSFSLPRNFKYSAHSIPFPLEALHIVCKQFFPCHCHSGVFFSKQQTRWCTGRGGVTQLTTLPISICSQWTWEVTRFH